MATPEDIQTFLRKRGYEAQVSERGDAYIIELRSKSLDEVAIVLASIHEGKRLIVTAYHPDIAGLIVKDAGLPEQFEALRTDVGEVGARSEARDHELGKRISDLLQVTVDLSERLDVLEKKPWWKRIWRKW